MGRKSKNKRPADDQSSVGADDSGPGTSGLVADCAKLRPVKKHKTVAPSAESSRLFDDAINAVLSQGANDSMDTSDDDVHSLTNTVTQLVQKVQDQQETIAELKQQVSFLLSYLGVNATSPTDGTLSTKAAGEPSSALPPSSGSNQQQTAKTYASVSAGRPVPLSSALKQAVVSAVYGDLNDKNRRSRNFVVSGLPVDGDDKAAVEKILADDFDQNYTVLKCRRLGRPQNDKLQPLLVTMEHDTHATYVTCNARRLRQSANETVRKSVFINPDLTRAEAFTAYQSRCERRRREAKRQPAHGPPAPSSSSIPPPPAQMKSVVQSPAADVAPLSASPAGLTDLQQPGPSAPVANASNSASTNLRPTATAFAPTAAAVSDSTTPSSAVHNNTASTSESAVGLSVDSSSPQQ